MRSAYSPFVSQNAVGVADWKFCYAIWKANGDAPLGLLTHLHDAVHFELYEHLRHKFVVKIEPLALLALGIKGPMVWVFLLTFHGMTAHLQREHIENDVAV